MGRANRERSEAVRTLLSEEGLGVNQAARRLGVPPSTVSYYARRLGIPPTPVRRYDWAEVQRYYDQGDSLVDCRRQFGMASKTLVDAVRRGDLVTRPHARPLPQLLVPQRKTNRSNLKRRLIAEGLKDGCCERCGIKNWRGLPLSLQVHHSNGIGDDNRLENLRLLCPNCHSQTQGHSRKRRTRR
jgi:5-methylcytosine-specific restriction endonuclease McrA